MIARPRLIKTLRIVAGLGLIAVLLHAASLAARDCYTAQFSADNCLWLWVRARLGLAPSRLGRVLALELTGLVILAGLYLTVRHVFPRQALPGSSRTQSLPASEPRDGTPNSATPREP